jgi:hypothetical protein
MKTNEMSNRQMGKGKAVSAIVAMLLLLGIIAAITGCGGRSALIGRWEEEGKPDGETLEFFKDGTVDFDGLTVKWKVKKGRLMLSFLDMTQIINYEISGSTLTLSDDDGLETKFIKLKKN